ncbi:MAG: hypothetical protein K1X39_03065 [Thermoflexales bacterium]|nr:hypothetical protein [Thermoflexales bacterium]
MSFRSTETRSRRFDPASNPSRDSGQGRRRLLRGIGVVLLAFVVLVGGGGFLGSDQFRVREARVEGNEGIAAQGILAASGVMGEHWLLLDLNASARRVQSLPGIDAANITCEWQKPCLILVKVSQALARLDGPDGTMWLDATGRAQRTWDNARARTIVRLEDGATLPRDGGSVDPALTLSLTELAAALPNVSQYTYSAKEGLSFVNERNTRVKLGTSTTAGEMRERAGLAELLKEQLIARNIQPKVIDVHIVDAPFYVR